MMETIDLVQITISGDDIEVAELTFSAAQLVIVQEFGSKQWYVDTTDAGPSELLDHYYVSDNIAVQMTARTNDGRTYSGTAYVHANVPCQACVLRGDGELTEA
ncbi:hypothetical protein DFQ01_102330 [Paenibacillus cellulosilyticus]|uniref:Uncharacterized protein n=1 Tax=Paenibacillus cellulosilyticus TaxID=375489 RepID=A0A2V2Z7U9_9BACL|nr:hypothetical protein [Paenibacillus cellulosilyticus]PWW07436.1 hypothetical protein DFQ01_102330 [Paenibacillus cellulosilyticus]QKS44404.1 hypothetical protein HUB94_08235 [Paenibacillus cellulosilyticus]